ncbi:MAG: hypothetical protein COB85_05580 [Bacteroidetes bacterium]|nr:MAG: hypothetical protein COB85_05580 [Bacteroidota bacterium]
MKPNYLLVTILVLFSTDLKAQWDIITSFNNAIMDMKSHNGNLYIGGGFTKNDNSTCYWSAYYDGTSIMRHTNLIGGGGVRKLDEFDGDLYAVGDMLHGSVIGVSRWDGSTWVNGGGTNYSHSTLYSDGTELYVESDDGVVRKKSIGGSFQPYYDFAGNGGLGSIINYNNQLIFAGSFDTINGVPANNIAKWDGVNWTALGSGISSGTYSMAVFNSELYVAGDLSTAGGQNVNKIAKWNGATWSDVGGGVTGTSWNDLRDMVVFNGALYVVGDFTEMGNVTTHDVAKWDGNNWNSVNLAHTDAFANCVEVYANKLYVGTFDIDTSHVFVYTGSTTTLEETDEVVEFNVFPNPFSKSITIQVDDRSPIHSFRIYDLGGKLVKTENGLSTEKLIIDRSSLPNGTYFLELISENTVLGRQKIVIQ